MKQNTQTHHNLKLYKQKSICVHNMVISTVKCIFCMLTFSGKIHLTHDEYPLKLCEAF